MRKMLTMLALLTMIAASTAIWAQVPQCKVLPAKGKIIIDGFIVEPAWALAQALKVACVLGSEQPSPVKTTARICYDKDNLYLAFESHDQDLWATMTKRDDPLFKEEAVEVFLDPRGDGQRYLEMGINYLNAQYDLLLEREDGRRKARWDWSIIGLRSTTKTSKWGWTVEIAIPFQALTIWEVGFPPRSGDVWRIQLCRVDRPDHETPIWISWAPVEKSFHEPEHFGKITFQ